MTKEEIGAILKELRLQSGKTQQQVAELLNRKQQIIGHWETGYSQPDANTLFLLCDIYGASIDAAFGFSTTENERAITPEELRIISKLRKLDERGKKAVCDTLDREYQYIEEQQAEFVADRTDYIKKHALPFAAAGGDSSNLAEAQELYDAKRREGKDGK